jgi:hypothetical protein
MSRPVARLDWIAKAGFVARGLVYVLFGTIALTARNRTEDGQRAVFDALHDLPLGGVLLVAMALGLVAYGVFRLACGVLDIEGKGSTPKGLAGRAAQVGSGLFHLAIAWTAAQFIDGASAHAGNRNSETAARTLLDLQFGDIGQWSVAAGCFFAAGLQVRKAFKGSHMKQCAADTPEIARHIGRVGLITRGLIFAVIGWSFIRVADTDRPGEAQSAGAAVASLQGYPALYTAVALGLILFGVFSLLLARYRVVPAIDVAKAAKVTARKVKATVEDKL